MTESTTEKRILVERLDEEVIRAYRIRDCLEDYVGFADETKMADALGNSLCEIREHLKKFEREVLEGLREKVESDLEDALPNQLSQVIEAWKIVKKKGKRFEHDLDEDSSWTGIEVSLGLIRETQFVLRMMVSGIDKALNIVRIESNSQLKEIEK